MSEAQVVYELMNGGRGRWSRVGIFTNVETAKHVASLVLDSFREYDGDPDTEQTDYNSQWVMKRETFGPRGKREVGEPKPFRVYGSEGSAFKIDTITLNEGRCVGTLIFPSEPTGASR